MNFSVYNHLPIGQVRVGAPQNAPIFRYVKPSTDNVSINRELDKYLNQQTLQEMVNANPVINSLLKPYNIKPVINLDNFKQTTYLHSIDTKNISAGIYNSLPADLKGKTNIAFIQQAAVLHDIGKVLIPEKILNKRAKLNDDELKIMQLHSKLSEALLSSQNINPKVLDIIKYHHQNRAGNGYPQIKNTLNGYDINTEIVALADKYSALTEKRSYKNPLSPDQALSTIRKDVDEHKIDPRVYNALVGYVNNLEKNTAKTKSAA